MIQKIKVMTSFGPVPYDVVKEYLPKKAVEMVETCLKEIAVANCIKELLGEDFYISRLAEKKGWEYNKMISYIDNLTKFNPAAAFMVLLREIAIDFDSQYEDSIKDSDEIWTISLLNGKAEKVCKPKIKNYRNFPAFRSQKEAEEARVILGDRLRKMF